MKKQNVTSKISTTVNRGWLKRQIDKGLIEGKMDFYFTDDYRFDAMNDFGSQETFLPVKQFDKVNDKKTCLQFTEWELDVGRGCWTSENEFRFTIGDNCCYTLRVIS